ncbi:MAG: hypothetical protein RDV48_00425 [Candidatus Eremiobacteraeota bacterium]|nr:hypothetical protein [Candidatus Eremiobacteraeota bacterium]
MTLQSVALNQPVNLTAQEQAKPRERAPQQADAQPQDSVSVSDGSTEHKKEDITIKQAVTGLASAVAGAGIETVGNTASSLVNLPKAVYHAGRTIWMTDTIGPVLKTTLTALLPVATVAAPIIVAVGSLGYGMFHGFGEGVEHGFGSAVKATADDVKHFHNDLAKKAVDAMQEFETPHLEPGEKPYDIKLVEAGKGLVGAVAGGTIEGVGIGGLTLAKTPKATYRTYEAIYKTDSVGPVIKTTASILVPVAVALATPLGTVGGAVYGVYKGFADAYKEGLVESVKNRAHDVKEFHETTSKWLSKSWAD